MDYNEHILTHKAHEDIEYLNDLLSYMNKCEKNSECHEAMLNEDDCEYTARQLYFVGLHYAKGRETYPKKNCHDCDTDKHSEYVCIKCEVNQAMGEE